MKAGRFYVAFGESRQLKYARNCSLDLFQMMLGVLFDFALDFGVISSEGFVKDVIRFVPGNLDSVEDLRALKRHYSKSYPGKVV